MSGNTRPQSRYFRLVYDDEDSCLLDYTYFQRREPQFLESCSEPQDDTSSKKHEIHVVFREKTKISKKKRAASVEYGDDVRDFLFHKYPDKFGGTKKGKQSSRSGFFDTERSTVESIEESSTATKPTTWQAVIWAAAPDKSGHKTIANLSTLAIEIYNEDNAILRGNSWFTEERERIKQILGSGFLLETEDGFVLHQSAVIAMMIKSSISPSVQMDILPWPSFAAQLKQGTLRSRLLTSDFEPNKALLFLPWTTTEPDDLDIVYDYIRLLRCIHGVEIRTYPNEYEAWQERVKLGDIRALDEIAAKSEWKFAFRPRSCYGFGPCVLPDEEVSIHKRTHSGCAEHVEKRTRSERGLLTCNLGVLGKGRTRQTKAAKDHWFHQEYIPSLETFGEFRAFVVSEPDKEALRGRKGKIIKIIRTSWDWKNKLLAAKELDLEDLNFPECKGLQRSVLETFVLYIFDQLRLREDATTHFESLDVGGVRIDVGISSDGRLFVLEATRWHSAHFFSIHAWGNPKTQACEAYAKAFCSYFFG